MRLIPLTAAIMAVPAVLFAAGSEDPLPPKTTKTTTECTKTEIFDEKTKTCIDSQTGALDDDTRYDAVRELTYTGKFDRALSVLATMSNQSESRVLTYYGFIERKTGDIDTGLAYYKRALTADPDNILARAYMGQTLLQIGDRAAAEAQLNEIRARGGKDSWPEFALQSALAGGPVFTY